MPSFLVTGASRGIGLAIIQKLLQDPDNLVIATARDVSVSKALQDLRKTYPRDRLASFSLILETPSSIDDLARDAAALLPNGLDCLISNAGVAYEQGVPIQDLDIDLLEKSLQVNSVAPVRLVCAFLPLIRKGNGKKIVFITSGAGSMGDAPSYMVSSLSYSMSKAALNMYESFASCGTALFPEGFTVVLIHPGWVETDMGNDLNELMKTYHPDFPKISAEESAEACLRIAAGAKPEPAIKFYNYDGTEALW
ncbi:NAD(P)-binding protein [Wolfiporia cocos MD-104 SS10]|uniref:NAD(P)-binding protein n=1 Tax=Wolfiporia cocos (strain MD-104) TaxID=742152 RepID=A0A2H3JWP9_WOLCO|nr:NAD(P)-binding protein [Wolfiporia cocos MD-104 SS10]